MARVRVIIRVEKREHPLQLEKVASKLITCHVQEIVAFLQFLYRTLVVPRGGPDQQVLIVNVLDSERDLTVVGGWLEGTELVYS